ncbi:MAG: UDP-N-acetylmuramoyl-tripeptide--D-alanyl-D-alanine ligase [Puniceicoccaceae bacterium MED-G32]|nr:MAG: UDP-N-acetylmuramoyl-tripeptide--D-alanyl-D-alanine ligase [Puniceicoccaceae bacterium MED-G32]
MVLRGEELAKWTGGFWQGGVPSTVEGLFFDTRIIEPNSLFIALSYGVRDGHDFVEKALERGASACMVEKALAYDIPQLIVPDSLEALANIARNVRGNFKNPVIGITGSCGKTSTKAMLEKVLGSDRTHTTSGNWNNCLGVSMTLAELHETDYGFSVIEAGVSGQGEMSVLSSIIRPNVCVFTNIGEAHLEGFGTVDSIAEEKSKLLESAEKGALVVAPKTVLERSVFEKYREDAVVIVKGSVETISPFKKVYGYEWTRLENHSAKVSLCCGDKNYEYQLESLSEGILQNSALAVVLAIEMNVGMDRIIKGIESWKPVGGRGTIIPLERSDKGFIYQDSYNANPSSMLDSLKAFENASEDCEQRLYVLGIMNELGENACTFHESVAKALKPKKGDRLIFIGDSELTDAYEKGAKSVGWDDSELESFLAIELCNLDFSQFTGAIFLKGSRSCQLEALIPMFH